MVGWQAGTEAYLCNLDSGGAVTAKQTYLGVTQGEALLLQRQLVRRFGALPNEVVNQIATATSEQIEAWGDRVLDACHP